eukprot:136065_1
MRQSVDYYVDDDTFNDNGKSTLLMDVRGDYGNNYYTQFGTMLYWIDYNVPNMMIVYNMKTKQYTSITMPQLVGTDACVTAGNGQLFITGGHYGGTLKTVQIYNTSNNHWLSSPQDMHTKRYGHCCVYHHIQNTLWVIGGYGPLNTIEIYNMVSWSASTYNLKTAVVSASSTLYDNTIIVIGGWDGSNSRNDIQIIDTDTGIVSDGGYLHYAVDSGSGIKVNDIYYLFGGLDGSQILNTMQYLKPSTKNATAYSPSNIPSKSPTTSKPTTYSTTTLLSTEININITSMMLTLDINDNDSISFNSSWINYVIAIFCVVIFLVIILFGQWHSKKNKYIFNVYNIIWFGYHLLDFATDILFVLLLFNKHYNYLFLVSLSFLFLSSMVSVFQLNRNIKIWIRDNTLNVTEWFERYTTFLYFVCFIVGSCQSAVQLCNSNFLQLNRFSLKLNKYYQMKLHNEHLWSSVVIENIPQLVLEAMYIIQSNTLNDITLLAMVFSISSILMAPFIYITRS